MQNLNAPKMLLIILFAVLVLEVLMVLGCGHVIVYDTEVCGNLGPYGAHCVHTLTEETRDVNVRQWQNESIGWLCMDSKGFNDTETSLDQLCATTNLCDYQTRQVIEDVKARLRPILERAKAAKRYSEIEGE